MTNPREILGVSENADDAEIKSAYRRLAKEHHPDRNGGSEDSSKEFLKIQEAYDALRGDKPQGAQPGQGTHADFNEAAFNDMFSHMFRNAHRHHNNVQSRIIAHVEVDLLSMMKGCKAQIQIPDGTVVECNIPAGARDGHQIVMPGRGGLIDGENRGELIVMVRQAAHPNYARQNDHLLTKVEVDLIDALVGREMEINLLDGSKKTITISPNSNPNTVVAVEGAGFPNVETDQRGNLYVHLAVRFRKFTEDQLDVLKSLTKDDQ